MPGVRCRQVCRDGRQCRRSRLYFMRGRQVLCGERSVIREYMRSLCGRQVLGSDRERRRSGLCVVLGGQILECSGRDVGGIMHRMPGGQDIWGGQFRAGGLCRGMPSGIYWGDGGMQTLRCRDLQGGAWKRGMPGVSCQHGEYRGAGRVYLPGRLHEKLVHGVHEVSERQVQGRGRGW